jgi:hypothetical protein
MTHNCLYKVKEGYVKYVKHSIILCQTAGVW